MFIGGYGYGRRARICALLLGLVVAAAGALSGSAAGLGAYGDESGASRWVDEQLRALTLERKVAQLICDQLRGDYLAEDHPSLQRWIELVRDYGVGGFVLYGGTPIDAAFLLNRLQREAEVPLLVAADFEGGPGQQLAGASEFPGNMALSAIGSDEVAYQVGQAGAREGRAVGIHVTYSPTVDIQTQPNNPALSVRSFGGDLALVGRMTRAYIRGYQEHGMLATAKHYPGRGDVELIPGTEFTVNRKPAQQVVDEDLRPFRDAIAAGVALVMSDHIAVPSLTGGSNVPASVSPVLATTWLREKLGFEGLLTSDDMWYPKVTERFGAEEAPVMALQAGHDVILKPADAPRTIAAIVRAVRSGAVSERRIDASVRRVLQLKARLGLHRERFVDPARVASVVGSRAHRELVSRVADLSLTLLHNDGFFPTDRSRVGTVTHLILQRQAHDPGPAIAASKLAAAFPVSETVILTPQVDPAQYDRAIEAARTTDTVVVSLFSPRRIYRDNGRLGGKDLALLRRVAALRPGRVVVMSYGNPYHAPDVREAAAFMAGYGEGGFYGNQLVYVDAFIRLLEGRIAPRGRLPVAVSPEFPIGSGLSY